MEATTTGELIRRSLLGALLSVYMAKRGLRKGSLSGSGAAAALAVGLLGFATHFSFGFTLILFYFTSSQLTKYKVPQPSPGLQP
mmetsp:Transcript_40646/g.127161  ORF Transcript_40646/g.127161 Transcript_40646/m.127161 type:complete len:84 (-) Transcript_40646:2603-2854(-)